MIDIRKELHLLYMYRHAYMLALSAAMGSIFYGWDIGLIGGILSMASFQSYFGLDKKSAIVRSNLSGNIVSVLQAGCFFGAVVTGYLSGRFGRKPSLILAGVIYIVGSVIQCIVGLGSSQAVGLKVLYFSRFLGGIGVGMVSALVPAYVSECTPKAIRGRCTGMIQMCNNLGIMLAFWVNYSASLNLKPDQWQWRIPFIVQIVPGALFVVLMLFQPESPRWLTEQGQLERAANSLAFASGKSASSESVLLTLSEIQEEFEGKARTSVWTQFKMMGESRATAIRCFIPSLVMFFQQWTGTNAINYYSPEIFASLGITGQTSGLFATGIYGVVKVVSVSLVLAFAVESFGRKKCLILGGLVQAVAMLYIGIYLAVHTGTHVPPAGYASIVMVYIYAVGYCIGWGPVPWVVAGEVAPNHVRTAALSVAIGVNWAFSLTISKITPIMITNISYGTFLIFSICCFVMAIWAYVCFPETAGVALEEIKYLFESDMLVRALQDAPGGKVFLHGRRAAPLEELRARAHDADSVDDEKKDTQIHMSEHAGAREEIVDTV